MRELARRLNEHEGFADVVSALSRGQPATLDGVWGSSCALVAAALVPAAAELLPAAVGPLVVVCPHQDDIDTFCDDFSLFSSIPASRFPAWESEPSERVLHDDIHADRLRMLKQLVRGMDAGMSPPAVADAAGRPVAALSPVIATSIQSLLQPTPSRQRLAASSRRLGIGQHVAIEPLLAWLVERGFHATSAVELPGEFSSRGGLLDVFATDWYQPVRLEFFDDVIESLRRFDVQTQRSLESLDEIEITVAPPAADDRGHFGDYLPPSSIFLFHELERSEEEAKAYLTRLERPQDLHRFADVMAQTARFAVATAAGLARGSLGACCHLQIESVERFSGEIDRVRAELDQVGQGHEVFLVSQTEAEVERLTELLRTTQLAATGRLHLPLGTLRQGFRLARDQVIVITSGELFQRGELRRVPRRRLGKAIDSFLDLRQGDLVVHLAHGNAR